MPAHAKKIVAIAPPNTAVSVAAPLNKHATLAGEVVYPDRIARVPRGACHASSSTTSGPQSAVSRPIGRPGEFPAPKSAISPTSQPQIARNAWMFLRTANPAPPLISNDQPISLVARRTKSAIIASCSPEVRSDAPQIAATLIFTATARLITPNAGTFDRFQPLTRDHPDSRLSNTTMIS